MQFKDSCLGLSYDYRSITKIVFARFDAISFQNTMCMTIYMVNCGCFLCFMLDWFSFCCFFCLNRVLLLPLVWRSSQSVSCFSLEYGNTSPKVSINGGLLLNIIKCVCVCVLADVVCREYTILFKYIIFEVFMQTFF